MIGKTLAHYEITSQLGKGGMGEVYQAKDKKLGRDVAIKVLPQEFAQDADRVARFQREAKLLASLNHPNIAAIYGLEESDGTNFLVMELVEGQTLDERIRSGSIPVEEALKLALQIAEALEAAHEKGVIHRDLKPANIKVTPDGKVKVLDFGLAKAFAGEQADLNLSNSPTLSVAATQQGVILGTAAYMSPEQARGKEVDKRADIWAFGVVLFEILTGKQVFTGDTVSDTLASVLAREPEWQRLPANLHPRIRLLLERCLKKESKNRYHDIADARVDIQEVLDDPSGVLAQPVPSEESRTKFRTMIPWFAATLVLGAVIAGLAVWKLTAPDPPEVIRFDYPLPKDHKLSNEGTLLAISHDGKKLAYSTSHGIYVRPMNESNAWLIRGTAENTKQPFFSLNDKSIGYWSIDDSQLKIISVDGGQPTPLCKDPSTAYYDWGIDENIYYANRNGIKRISGIGGEPKNVIPSNDDEIFFSPQLLPDKKSVIYTIGVGGEYQIAVQSLNANDRKVLFNGATARYLKTGHLIYTVDNILKVVPFDVDKLRTTGEHLALAEDISVVNGPPHFCVSDSGTFAYLKNIYSNLSLVWVDFNGTEEKLDAEPGIYGNPKVSPDRSRIALAIQGETGNQKIGIMNISNGVINPITQNIGFARFAIWSTDSHTIYFAGSYGALSTIGIHQMSSSGTGNIDDLYTKPAQQIFPTSLSIDGRILLCQTWAPGLPIRNIGMLKLGQDPPWQPVFQNDKYSRSQPQFSPDDQWIAYTSQKSGKDEVCVCSFPEVEKVWEQISKNGGNSPLWSPNRRQLYYRDGDHVMAATYDISRGFDIVNSEPLFADTYYNTANPADHFWDIHPDGDKFLMMKETSSESNLEKSQPTINIIINWFEELKEKAPVP